VATVPTCLAVRGPQHVPDVPHPALRVCLTAAGQEQVRSTGLIAREYAKRELARPETDGWSIATIIVALFQPTNTWFSSVPARKL
jgi:hypothetical protein